MLIHCHDYALFVYTTVSQLYLLSVMNHLVILTSDILAPIFEGTCPHIPIQNGALTIIIWAFSTLLRHINHGFLLTTTIEYK